VISNLGTLGCPDIFDMAINDLGQVTGLSRTFAGGTHAFLWKSNVMTDLGAASSGGAADINSSGQVAGGQWLWTPMTPNGTTGTFIDLSALPPHREYPYSLGIHSVAQGINNARQVIGASSESLLADNGEEYYEVRRAFLWTNGVMKELPTLQNATAINNAGQIVGNGPYSSTGQSPYRAYLLIPESSSTPLLSLSDATVTEGNTGTRTATFTVTLSAAYSQPVTVAYATTSGTATAANDYQAASGTLTIPAGQTTGTITVLVNGDRLAEPNETFVVNLSSPTNATLADGQGVGTIVDDEPRISINNVSKTEGRKNNTTLFTFTVTLSAAYDQPVTMSFKTTDGTAKTGDGDYVAKSGTLTFAPGETTKTITIAVKGDSKKETDETFYLDLLGLSSNGLFTKCRGVGTILNDD
jgi:probable HAF family extracellular repeat protein